MIEESGMDPSFQALFRINSIQLTRGIELRMGITTAQQKVQMKESSCTYKAILYSVFCEGWRLYALYALP